MSLDSTLGAVQQLDNTVNRGVGTVTRLAADLGLPVLGAKKSYWKDQLRPASFRGVPFYVLAGQSSMGRRNAVHEYPKRDQVWAEDMGRAPRRMVMAGYIVGDDCIAQRARMIAAVETAGEGELFHPTLGRKTVAVLEFSSEERWDRGRVFDLHFAFIETGKRIFPANVVATGPAVLTACAAANAAASTDFLSAVGVALQSGAAVVLAAVGTAQAWARQAQRLVNDATNLYNIVQSLPGDFGRIFGIKTLPSTLPGATVASLIAAGTVAQSATAAAGLAVQTYAQALSAGTTGPFTAAAQALAAQVMASSTSPADALRLLEQLAVDPPPTTTSAAPVGQAILVMQGAATDLYRRAAVVALAQAASTYQPSSYNDAVAVQLSVAAAIDAEIAVAGDQAEDNAFLALRSLRAAVVQDLTARGANLAPLINVVSGAPVPAPVLAQRLYRDSTRADQLVAEGDPVHPAFMPLSFQALAQ